MKYFEARVYVAARTEKEATRLLLQHLKNNNGLRGLSMHCTDHDPTIPFMSINGCDLENEDMKDCTDGCHK